jgi:hypothetical protein
MPEPMAAGAACFDERMAALRRCAERVVAKHGVAAAVADALGESPAWKVAMLAAVGRAKEGEALAGALARKLISRGDFHARADAELKAVASAS